MKEVKEKEHFGRETAYNFKECAVKVEKKIFWMLCPEIANVLVFINIVN